MGEGRHLQWRARRARRLLLHVIKLFFGLPWVVAGARLLRRHGLHRREPDGRGGRELRRRLQ
jgi:hypothetical protein